MIPHRGSLVAVLQQIRADPLDEDTGEPANVWVHRPVGSGSDHELDEDERCFCVPVLLRADEPLEQMLLKCEAAWRPA